MNLSCLTQGRDGQGQNCVCKYRKDNGCKGEEKNLFSAPSVGRRERVGLDVRKPLSSSVGGGL